MILIHKYIASTWTFINRTITNIEYIFCTKLGLDPFLLYYIHSIDLLIVVWYRDTHSRKPSLHLAL